MKKLLLLALPLLFLGCQNDDPIIALTPPPLVTGYNYRTMHYPDGAWSAGDNHVALEYQNNLIVRRIGGLRVLDPATGGSYVFDTGVYDDVIYSGNRITVEAGKLFNFSTAPSTITTFEIGPQNRIVKKINVNIYAGWQESFDTLKYSYDTEGQLVKTSRGKQHLIHEEAKFYYSPTKNLDSIVTQTYQSTEVIRTIKEIFSDYDQSPNPLRTLFIFPETFLRSISSNNYMKYEKMEYDSAHELVAGEERTWTIPHDTNGMINFDSN